MRYVLGMTIEQHAARYATKTRRHVVVSCYPNGAFGFCGTSSTRVLAEAKAKSQAKHYAPMGATLEIVEVP